MKESIQHSDQKVEVADKIELDLNEIVKGGILIDPSTEEMQEMEDT